MAVAGLVCVNKSVRSCLYFQLWCWLPTGALNGAESDVAATMQCQQPAVAAVQPIPSTDNLHNGLWQIPAQTKLDIGTVSARSTTLVSALLRSYTLLQATSL